MEYRNCPTGRNRSVSSAWETALLALRAERKRKRRSPWRWKNGVNYFDMAAGDATPFPAYGRVVSGCRHKVYYQVHFGADYRSGKYGWTLDLDEIRRSVDWQLKALKTDYIDFGFIHCIDELSDLEKAEAHGTIAYIEELKRQGVIRHIGLSSSHTPVVAEKVLDMHILDMLMFSINPAYDYRHGEYAIGSGG